MLFAYDDSPGITVHTVYDRKFLEHHLCPALHCKWPHFLWSRSAVFHDNAQSHGLYSDWFVQKMELGSLGTSTIVTGYMPMWLQFLSGSERTITFHLLQDDIWWWCKWKDQAISDISRPDTADGVIRLLHMQQCFCNVAWHYIYSL